MIGIFVRYQFLVPEFRIAPRSHTLDASDTKLIATQNTVVVSRVYARTFAPLLLKIAPS
jgi:hypothetical protein